MNCEKQCVVQFREQNPQIYVIPHLKQEQNTWIFIYSFSQSANYIKTPNFGVQEEPESRGGSTQALKKQSKYTSS
jgi:hypothetical protein